MWKQKIGISVGKYFTAPPAETIGCIADTGFDAVSPVWTQDDIMVKTINAARECGLYVQSLHAPTKQTSQMWSEDAETARFALDTFLSSLEDCNRLEIPIFVVHSWATFDFSKNPHEKGLKNFEKLVDKATEYGIQIAFENLEGEKFLYALMEYFRGNPTVGFCWDSGHEFCYNHSMPLLSDFGDRLIMTHINDNMGARNFDGTIASRDDLHLLPYDGAADWDRNLRLLSQARRMEILNFEVKPVSWPGQHENDIYTQMPLSMYLAEAYKRAAKFAWRYAQSFE